MSLEGIQNATIEELTEIEGIGEVLAKSIVDYFGNDSAREMVKTLQSFGVNTLSKKEKVDDRFLGKTFVITGTLEGYTRGEMTELIEKYGGKCSGSVSKKTSYVLAGEEAGSKLDKAGQLGVPIISLNDLLEMIK
jgi:DNA ligase (NAD+)